MRGALTTVSSITLLVASPGNAYQAWAPSFRRGTSVTMSSTNPGTGQVSRREALAAAAAAAMGLFGGVVSAAAKAPVRARLPDEDTQGKDYVPLAGGAITKPRLLYSDFSRTPSGLQYKDAKKGSGPAAAPGDRVVLSWEGYTIGYNGQFFERRAGLKGGAFDGNEPELYRFVIGENTTIPAMEEGLLGMQPGGVRQLVVPPELGYPEGDRNHDAVGPKPSTFSGQRALDFVLSNPGFIDKTLLINVRLMRVDKPGERGFRKGRAAAAAPTAQ